MYADADADWVAKISYRQSVDAECHPSGHHEQRERPVTILHESWNVSSFLAKRDYVTFG